MGTNGIPILGKGALADQAMETIVYGTAQRKLRKLLAETGSTGQLVISFYPDGSVAVSTEGLFSPAAMLKATSAIHSRTVENVVQLLLAQELQEAAVEAVKN